MDQQLRKGAETGSQGYLGNSRVILNHFDAATQANIQHVALSYESEDEAVGGRRGRRSAHYSKHDIREQYCISERALEAADRQGGLFGCLSSHQAGMSPCSQSSGSLLTLCVRRRVPSDENLHELCRRPPVDYAPMPRYNRYPFEEFYRCHQESEDSYFRRRPRSFCATVDPSRYTWLPADEDLPRLERPRSVLDHRQVNMPSCLAHPTSNQPTRTKHVSFARSHTLTSFDDASSASLRGSSMSRSQERLLDGRKTIEPQPITRQPEPSGEPNALLIEKLKRTPMKTQATQTEVCLGRKPLPTNQLMLSPRTIRRVKMVSQGAQTNGLIMNGRRLMKSFSEAGGTFAADISPGELLPEHEPLQRTQSEEPPRSPFVLLSPPHLPHLPHRPESAGSGSLARSDHESDSESRAQKEIIIDFEPIVPDCLQQQQQQQQQKRKKALMKTVSDGEIHRDQRRILQQGSKTSPDPGKVLTSISHENISTEPQEAMDFTPYFQNSPIRHEDICKNLEGSLLVKASHEAALGLMPQDSLDEEFHENLIYRQLFRNGLSPLTDADAGPGERCKKSSLSPSEDIAGPACQLERKASPFASSDSLTTDARDQSDGMWNESQVTVLHADSGTENGTAYSTSDGTSLTASSPCSTTLTPSSKRRHLLMLQHQQRSSMDTEVLDEEIQIDQSNLSPRLQPKETPTISLEPPPPEKPLPQPQQQHQVHHHGTLRTAKKGSPLRPKRVTVERLNESPEKTSAAVVPDLLLARSDSGKTNMTDVSESTTTTEDYITANSTDSSRRSSSMKSGINKPAVAQSATAEGSSFESASSMYSLSRSADQTTTTAGDDSVVPSFSPPSVPEETTSTSSTKKGTDDRPTSPCASTTSSSSGSYSLDGSCPDLPHQTPSKVPSPRRPQSVPSLSDDERSAHYSSSGYYESPMEEDSNWKSASKSGDRRDWTDEEKRRKKRSFTLDVSIEGRKSPSAADKASADHSEERPKKAKSRTRSPMLQNAGRGRPGHVCKKSPPGAGSRSPAKGEKRAKDGENNGAFPAGRRSSDESSSDDGPDGQDQGPASPRKGAKKMMRDIGRKKSLNKAPAAAKGKRRPNDNSHEDKPYSVHGSLQRQRKIMGPSSKGSEPDAKGSRLSPYSRSPGSSPNKRSSRSPKTSPELPRLKALSAESLRSVSPGSDSVFYSDPSQAAAAEHQVHCLHCGKEVDIVTADQVEDSCALQHDIVQPPAGFADSPRSKTPTVRLYKKLEKRYRSEERDHHRRHRYRPDTIRAKSEERERREECGSRSNGGLRPVSRSTDSSFGVMRSSDSSPSVLTGSMEAEDDPGIYTEAYCAANWLYISDGQERRVWRRSTGSTDDPSLDSGSRRSSTESTDSEHEFRKKHQAVTHRMVHRRSCLEMYRRQALKSFESDKTVIVRRESGEFGFRIHGSKPVVVSAIETDTPAETSGLEVGDIVLAVNGVSVLDKSHSEVVKIAHAGSDVLTLEVARTCDILVGQPEAEEDNDRSDVVHSGYLWKLSTHGPTDRWHKRWFCLKSDNCLYFYKTEGDGHPVGARLLLNHEVVRKMENGKCSRPHRISIRCPGYRSIHLASETEQTINKWISYLAKAIDRSRQADIWLENTRRNISLAPNGIPKPDCYGYLHKLGTKWKSWNRCYCVLKDACVYFYQDATSKGAFGMACLHGYRVQQSTLGGKKYAFEVLPSDANQKHFYFHTDSDMDRKRWLAALEYSIDRWMKVG